MPLKPERKNCVHCLRSFLTYEKDKKFCSQDCLVKRAYKVHFGIAKEYQEKFCKWCGVQIASTNSKAFCDKVCKNKFQVHKRLSKNMNDMEWKEKKKGRKVSYEELNRREEYKRLYDDFHINRIIRGKS